MSLGTVLHLRTPYTTCGCPFISKFLIPLWVVRYLKISYDTRNCSLSHNSLYRLGLFFILEFLYHLWAEEVGGRIFISEFLIQFVVVLHLKIPFTTLGFSSAQNFSYHLVLFFISKFIIPFALFLISEFLIPLYVSLYLAIPYTTWGCASCISEFLIPLGVILHLKIQYNTSGCPHLTMPYTTSGCTYLRIPYTT